MLIVQRYYDSKPVGSYGGVAALRRVVPEQDIAPWLSEQDTYTLHKPVRRRFKRRCVVVGCPNLQWQADLVDMSRLKKVNDGTTFILTMIDVFSKLTWCGRVKNKSAVSLVAAFTQLLGNGEPNTLQTDKGTDYFNRPLQKLLKEHGVHHFATHNEETKASIVERFNRTLETRMLRYFTKETSHFDTSTSCKPLCDRTTTPIIVVSVWLHQKLTTPIRKPCANDCMVTKASAHLSSESRKQSERTLRKGIRGELDRRTVYDC